MNKSRSRVATCNLRGHIFDLQENLQSQWSIKLLGPNVTHTWNTRTQYTFENLIMVPNTRNRLTNLGRSLEAWSVELWRLNNHLWILFVPTQTQKQNMQHLDFGDYISNFYLESIVTRQHSYLKISTSLLQHFDLQNSRIQLHCSKINIARWKCCTTLLIF